MISSTVMKLNHKAVSFLQHQDYETAGNPTTLPTTKQTKQSASTMISSTVMKLNHKAVSFLQHQDYETAANLLQQGIHMVEHAMQDPEEQDEMDQVMPTRIALGPLASVSLSMPQQDSFGIYSHAMTAAARPLTDPDEQDEDQDLALLYGILFYNVGLCLHLQGLVSGTHVFLNQAKHCYETALGTLGAIDRNPLIVLLEVALLNNEAHIHSCLCDHERVGVCLNLMQTAIREVNADYQWRGNLPREFKPFSRNLVLQAGSQLRPAPAA
eukprot:CAMPEP_0168847580 /NCGR_PEP_ID=MMETSP0727-20121128/10392_1 /TAXON_ID=265536 /ORGANISM="Amphiprora sp., Strain CCMP467" /LENGTH=268 /DNA_ID=CAMNT_0008901391 /DNA_START=75 /DNA_END=881 /DNA_ORIENTATION=-